MRPSILFIYCPSVSPKEYKKYMHNMINAININVTITKHLKNTIANIYKNNANKKNFLLNLINIIISGKKKNVEPNGPTLIFNGLQIYFKAFKCDFLLLYSRDSRISCYTIK